MNEDEKWNKSKEPFEEENKEGRRGKKDMKKSYSAVRKRTKTNKNNNTGARIYLKREMKKEEEDRKKWRDTELRGQGRKEIKEKRNDIKELNTYNYKAEDEYKE